jgi:hypothetical protein
LLLAAPNQNFWKSLSVSISTNKQTQKATTQNTTKTCHHFILAGLISILLSEDRYHNTQATICDGIKKAQYKITLPNAFA